MGVENKRVYDAVRFGAANIAPAVYIGVVAGRDGQCFARRESDAVKQCEFETEFAARHDAVRAREAPASYFARVDLLRRMYAHIAVASDYGDILYRGAD
jgi:hypothetical protein